MLGRIWGRRAAIDTLVQGTLRTPRYEMVGWVTEAALHLRRYQRLQRVAEEEGDKADELQVYADFLRIVLEILNCILATNLPANLELVYAMLHQQEIFMPFQVAHFASSHHTSRVLVSSMAADCVLRPSCGPGQPTSA